MDSLRFVASVCVFLAHSVVFFKFPGVELSFGRVVKDAGYYGVIFFYTLSGFLITYLLLIEKKNTGTIAIKAFYIRRALRIWPLYYLIVLLSFFVIPRLFPGHPAGGIGNWKVPLLLYLFFLPNVPIFRGFYLATCFHTYTIGYEEQFYLLWPLVLRKAGKGFGYGLTVLFLLTILPQVLPSLINGGDPSASGKWTRAAETALAFVNFANIPAFLAGAGAAFLYLEGSPGFLAAAGKKIWRYALGAATLGLMVFTIPEGLGYVNGISLVFGFLILHLVQSGARGGRIGSLLARGGKISYGIYIYHAAVLIFVSFGMARVHLQVPGKPLLTYLIYLIVCFGLLLGTAAVSYRYFELFFLRRKAPFQPRLAVPEGGNL